ncbi:MAG TPA: choice-of-anchor V domain-containing protein [Gemmatimonadales bacterium]
MARAIPLAAALAVAVALIAGARPIRQAAFPDRPPLGHTGGFGEPTCARCHAGDPLNQRGGALTLDGLPPAYQAGGRYRLTVTMTRPRIRRSGFQLAIRFAGEDPPGRAAGTLRRIDDRVQVADSLGVTYAFHTGVGSVLTAPDRAAWALEWVAPSDSARPLVAHVAANAANDDGSELGDFIYADSVVSQPQR